MFARRPAGTLLFAALASLAQLAGCGGGAGSGEAGATSEATTPSIAPTPAPTPAPSPSPAPSAPPSPPTGAEVLPDVAFLNSYMRDWYLWRDRMPSPELRGVLSANEALRLLTVPEDRHSYIDNAQVFNQFFDEGRTVGYGLGYEIRGDKLWIRLIQPLAPAAAVLRRGDRILAIDDVPAQTLIAENRVDAAFGAVQVGVTGRFQIERDGAVLELSVTKANYILSSVLDARVLVVGGRRIGYINLYAFNNPARSAWASAIGTLLEGGAQDVVVDLRDNSGGLLSLTADVASSLAPADAAGGLFIRSEYNSGHPESNYRYTFSDAPGLGRFERIAWLTSERTCSASEALIVGLRAWRNSIMVGGNTCGKPVGFNPEQSGGKVYSIVTFRLVSRSGESDYFNGLAPDCSLRDDFRKPFGDPEESLLSAALTMLSGQPCPVAAATPKTAGDAGSKGRWDLRRQIGLQ